MMRNERDWRVVRPGGYALHAWLDGEGSEAAARRESPAAGRDVALWKRLGIEAARRRAEGAPAGLQARILAVLPDAAAVPVPLSPARPVRG